MKNLILLMFVGFFSLQSIATERAQIHATAEDVRPLLNGMTVPNVKVKLVDGTPVSLQALLMRKPSVIVFYRGGWCPYCSRQLAELKSIEQDLVDQGYQILAISPESVSKLEQQKLETEFAVELISDENLEAIRSFGIGFYVEQATSERYKEKMDVDLTKDESAQSVLPAPAVFITNTEGLVLFNYVNPNYKVRPSAALILSAAKLLK